MALSASFAGKRVLVTGGASGIGRAVVERLAKDKAIVTALDRNQAALDDLKKSVPGVNTLQADVSRWSETKEAVKSLGVLDHLVNNAGVGIKSKFFKIEEQDFNKIFDINVKAVINITQTVAQAMIENKVQGSIVNTSSVSSQRATKDLLLYAATKGAVSNITKTMALELGRAGIRVNSVCPAPVDTPLIVELAPNPESVPLLYGRNCLRRLVKPDEVADLILFLLSNKAAMITGQNVFIDGGYTTN